MSRVLIVSQEKIGHRMAGPAIRSWEVARVLARSHDVTLAAPGPIDSAGPADVKVVEAKQSILRFVAATAQVIVAQPGSYARLSALSSGAGCRVVDLYDPSIIEGLEIHRGLGSRDQRDRRRQDLDELEAALALGDYFLCASEAQRNFWLGLLVGAERVNETNYRLDPTLRSLIDLCPFGVSEAEPPKDPGCLRRRFPAIGERDPVVVWAGGIWNWFDPLTLLRGTALAVRSAPRLRLVFLGAGHPEPGVPAMAMERDAHRLAGKLGLTGRNVFFNDGWIPYAERGAYLREAAVGASLHLRTIETTLAFRTRLLDHLWAGLPSLVTRGDALGDAIVAAGAGISVDPADVGGVATALTRLTDPAPRAMLAARARELARTYQWSAVTEHLAAFCESPRPAPDRGEIRRAPRGASAIWRRGRRAWTIVHNEGWAALADRATRYLRARLG